MRFGGNAEKASEQVGPGLLRRALAFVSGGSRASMKAQADNGYDSDESSRAKLLSRALGSVTRPSMGSSSAQDVVKHLVENHLLEPAMARAATMEARVRGVAVSNVLGEKGTVPREKIVQAIESADVGMLANGVDYDVRLPKRLLRELKIVCHAQTDTKLMISSNSNLALVRQLIAPYLDGRELVEVPFSWSKWAEFEQNIDRIIEPDASRVRLDNDLDPRSVVSEFAEDAEVLDLLIDYAAYQGVSDLHIEPQVHTYNVFFRYLGRRKLGHCGSIEQYERVCAMVKDRARVDPMERRIPQDGSFSTQVRGRPYDVRVATIPSDGREKIVLRLLDPVRAQMALSQLGITLVDDWRRINEHRNGLVLIVGETGSGKTTTLNATIREMERLEQAVYTIEDPVEYRIPHVTHVQVNNNVGLNFASAIRAFVRGDPDIIMVGEIRDPETAAKAIQAAETGHLVIATIHAESVPMAIQRLRNLNVKVEDFESLLRGVMIQFLVRTLCSECKGEGCENCFNEGYSGRTVISEVVRVRAPSDVAKMMSTKEEDKFWRPLWQDIESKLLAGVTDGREIYRNFSAELEEMAKHSPVLAKVLREERAKRDRLAANLAVSSIEALPEEERKKQRKLVQARLQAVSARPEGLGVGAAGVGDDGTSDA